MNFLKPTENSKTKNDTDEGYDKLKRSPLVLSAKSYRQLQQIAKIHEDNIGKTMKGISEHFLKRIVNGQYEIEPKKREKPHRILVNQYLLKDVRKIAKENNYTLSELIDKVIVEEHLKQAMNRGDTVSYTHL